MAAPRSLALFLLPLLCQADRHPGCVPEGLALWRALLFLLLLLLAARTAPAGRRPRLGSGVPGLEALEELRPPDLRRRLSLARGQARWPRARESLCARFLGTQHKPRWTRRDDSQGLKLTRCSRLGEAQDQAPGAPKGRLGKAKRGGFRRCLRPPASPSVFLQVLGG